jgi:pimeloyl-ACP methyl ester carboxylesterase
LATAIRLTRRKFPYTFDKLAEIVEHFLDAKGFDKFGLFVQDYGGPVGFRIVGKRPELLEWLIIQNTNAYEIGFTDAWGGLRHALWLNRSAENEAAVAGLLELETVKAVYLTVRRSRSLSARTIGIRITCSPFSALMASRFNSISSMTTVRTSSTMRSGRHSSNSISRRRSSSGARAISSSLQQEEKPIWKSFRTPRSIG